jgi:hypothetical protein
MSVIHCPVQLLLHALPASQQVVRTERLGQLSIPRFSQSARAGEASHQQAEPYASKLWCQQIALMC